MTAGTVIEKWSHTPSLLSTTSPYSRRADVDISRSTSSSFEFYDALNISGRYHRFLQWVWKVPQILLRDSNSGLMFFFRALNLRHGTYGFTSLPKEVILRIFTALKINPSTPAGFEPPNLGSSGEYDNHGITGDRPTFFVAWYQLSNILVIEASRLCFQPILYADLQLIVPKCCSPTTVSYEERDTNHREPSPGGWWWVIKHFPLKMLHEPLCCSCSMRPSIVMKKNNTWEQHSSSLVLNKGI